MVTVIENGHRPRGTSVVLGPLVEPLARRLAHEHVEPSFRRDPQFLRHQMAAIRRLTSYFTPEVRGLDNVPATGPALVVGNHSGLFYMPDVWVVGLSLLERRGFDEPVYALAYDLLFGVPVVGPFLRRIGTLPAGGDHAEEAIARGAAVVVYPGGDREACRPWTQRDRVDLGGHMGFVRLALRAGVPVVPVVCHGSHHAVVVVSRGERVARALGLSRLRINVFPFLLGPLGITSVLTPPLPLPASITVEFLPPLDWSDEGPDAAADDEVVARRYDEITRVMQAALDRLSVERPHPVRRGVANLARGVAGHASGHPGSL